MYLKGGFVYLSLENKNIASGGNATIAGIYDKLEGNYGKAVMLGDIKLDNVEMSAQVPSCVVSNSNYVLTFVADTSAYVLTIDDTDKVSFTKKALA